MCLEADERFCGRYARATGAPVVLKLPRPLLLGPGGRLAAHEEEGGQENALVVAERAWFAKRLRDEPVAS